MLCYNQVKTTKEVEAVAISYKPLFITLAEKEVSLNDLFLNDVVSSATQRKFRKNANMHIESIAKVCLFLNVPVEKVVEIRLE